MNLADDVAGILPLLRQQAEALMLDVGVLERVDGSETVDPETFEVIEGRTTIYSGKAKVQATVSQAGDATAGGYVFTVGSATLHLPVSAPLPHVDDVWTVTGSEVNPHLVGMVFRVVDPGAKTFSTAQRVRVEMVIG